MDANWSNELAEFTQESSRDHFIDILNRRLAVKAALEHIGQSKARILDVGCSSGYLLQEMAISFPAASLWGMDCYDAGLKKAAEIVPTAQLQKSDIAENNFPDEFFDTVTCLNVLEHIKDDEKALRDIWRVLKNGSVAFFSVPAGPELFDFYDELHGHERRYTLKQLEDVIKRAGFSVAKANYFGSFVCPGFYLVKKINKFRFAALDEEQKRRLIHEENRSSGSGPLFAFLSSVEEKVGDFVKYPFGVRAYVVAKK